MHVCVVGLGVKLMGDEHCMCCYPDIDGLFIHGVVEIFDYYFIIIFYPRFYVYFVVLFFFSGFFCYKLVIIFFFY
jgi:hypothetical protein